MQLEDIKTNSVRIEQILASYSRVNNLKEYCSLIDAEDLEKNEFRYRFTDPQYRGIKLDAKVLKKHIQNETGSGSGFLKYNDEEGFTLLDYI